MALWARDAAIRLVGQFLDRPVGEDGLPHGRPVPVVTFVGGRGSGKTALLSELVRQIDQQAPFARLDCRTTRLRSTREILSALAFDLNRQCGRYGSLGFPRFVVGQLIIAQELDPLDREHARRQVQAILEGHNNVDALKQFLGTVATNLLAAMNVPGAATAGRYIPDLLLRGLVSGRFGRKVLIGTGANWYAHQDHGATYDARDVLVDLNRNARAVDPGLVQEADELLWAAFLADLRYAFGTGRRRREASWNCAILVDDVDTPVGLALLEGLIGARQVQNAAVRARLDPITIVATSRAPLAPAGRPLDAEQASFKDWENRCRSQPGGEWYPVWLRDLSAAEVLLMVKALELHDCVDRDVAQAVHRFTGGHPGSTQTMLNAITHRPADAADPAAILRGPAGPAIGAAPPPVDTVLLDAFVTGLSPTVVEDLITCSAARDVDHASRSQALDDLLTTLPAKRPEVFSENLWPRTDPAQPGRMWTVLRRLLLMRLAERGSGAPASWGETHAALRRECRETGDETGDLYHALALGEVEPVARRLAELLPRTDIEGWLDLLGTVTHAPSRLPPTGDIQYVSDLTEWAATEQPPLEALARLVAAKWMAAHPLLSGHQKDLHLELAADYDAIAPYSGNGRARLRLEAQKHRGTAGPPQ